MPTRIPLVQIGVQRNGDTVYPPIGQPFSFTAEEVTEINKLQSETKRKYFDKIEIAETESADEPKKLVTGKSNKSDDL